MRAAIHIRYWSFRLCAAVLALAVLSACAGYSQRIREPRRLFEEGQYDAAAQILRSKADDKDGENLLYLMELGSTLHTAGKHEDAIRTFSEAEEKANLDDYTSLTGEVGSVLLNEEVAPYKGEYFERVLLHVFMAIDFTLLSSWDSALVECRRINRALERLHSEQDEPFFRNIFAKYLAAVLFESQGDWNAAFVDYRTLLKWDPQAPYLGESLLRVAGKLGAEEEFESYRKRFPDAAKNPWKKDEGEVFLILEHGRAPIKVPSEQFRLIPRFARRYTDSTGGVLRAGKRSAATQVLYSVEDIAIAELTHRTGRILAKKLAGVAAKEAVAYGLGKAADSDLVRALARLAFWAQDKADLRSWNFLPANFQIARLRLPAGRHSLRLDMVSGTSVTQASVREWKDVEVRPGAIAFLNARIF